jgi:predicted ATPase
LIQESRLVTLTGEGGIGKTRLALEVARQAITRHRDGVWLVELAPVDNPELLDSVALAAIGSARRPGRNAPEALINSLTGSEMLFILDNCEHLVDAVARLASVVLQRCPDVCMLATSREVLNVSGETTWRVPPMSVPGASRSMTREEIERVAAVQLFVERAEVARPGFRLSDDTAGSVGRICRRLDGIPLAIELAAARVRTLPISAIDTRLDDHLGLLSSGSRTSPPRQRTLRATLDWSYELLTAAERRLFRHLAVCRGGFSLEAAEQICADQEAGGAPAALVDEISSLIDKSLVFLEEPLERPSRFRLLEPVRDYADGLLRATDDAEELEGRHALYYMELAERMRAGGDGPDRAWFTWAADEVDNLRAAFEWAVVHDPSASLRLTLAIKRHWILSEGGEGRTWLARGLAASPDRDELRAEALWTLSFWATFHAEFLEARQLADEALLLARELGSVLHEGWALHALAINAWLDTPSRSEESLSFFDEAEADVRRSGDRWALVLLLNNYGCSLSEAGEIEAARAKLQEGAAIAGELKDDLLTTAVLGSLADNELAAGNREEAQSSWRRQLELARAIGSQQSASSALTGLARFALNDGKAARCLQLLGAATELFRRTGSRLEGPDVEFVGKAQTTARELIGPELAEVAWTDGVRMSLEEAVRFALAQPTEAEPQLPDGDLRRQTIASVDNAFICEGALWTLSFAGTVAHVKDSKGMRDLGRLLAAPGVELAAVDLAGVAIPIAGVSVTGRAMGELGMGVEKDAGPVIDAEARQSYRRRLADLEEDIGEAVASNDPERAARAREEREFLLAELGAAVGLGGRERRLLDPAERARKAVAGRIRDALDHIEAAHPELARHLRRSLRTGAFCTYDPAMPTTWVLRRSSPGATAVPRQAF